MYKYGCSVNEGVEQANGYLKNKKGWADVLHPALFKAS